jgi:aryl-alcohol dehydrogenase-like predicted oxidoreductase
MESRTLGKNGRPVTRLGLGLAALGRPGYINLGHAGDLRSNYDLAQMEQHSHAVLDAAWEAGIRYFDAARSYGRAEQFLAGWLVERDIDPSAVTTGSKWGYTYTAGWQVTAEQHEVKEHSLPVLERQIGESQSLLGTYLDLYQIHSATLESGVLENQEVLSRLAELRDSGLQIGLSTSGPNQSEVIERALDIEFDARPLFTAVQATWNLLSQEAGGTLQQAHEAGRGIIIKEALANGRLTARNNDPQFNEKRQFLEQLASKSNTTIDALALAAVLAQSWVDVALSGAATVPQLESNVQALQIDIADDLQVMVETLREQPEEYWQTRSDLSWN